VRADSGQLGDFGEEVGEEVRDDFIYLFIRFFFHVLHVFAQALRPKPALVNILNFLLETNRSVPSKVPFTHKNSIFAKISPNFLPGWKSPAVNGNTASTVRSHWVTGSYTIGPCKRVMAHAWLSQSSCLPSRYLMFRQ
jgi:hypothetical protein